MLTRCASLITRYTLLGGFILAAAAPTTAAQVTIELDHATGALRFPEPLARRVVDSVDVATYRLRHSGIVKVRVVNTNTALYQFKSQEEQAPVLQSMQALRGFAPLLKDYLPELGLMVRAGGWSGRSRGGSSSALPDHAPQYAKPSTRDLAEEALSVGHDVDNILTQLHDLLHGAHGMEGVHGLTLRTLDRMRQGEIERQADAMGSTPSLCLVGSCRTHRSPTSERGKSLGIAGCLLVVLEHRGPRQPHYRLPSETIPSMRIERSLA